MFWQYWDKAFHYDFDVSKVEYFGFFTQWWILHLVIFCPNLGQKEDVKEN